MERRRRDGERKHLIKMTRLGKVCILGTTKLYTHIAERGAVGVLLSQRKKTWTENPDSHQKIKSIWNGWTENHFYICSSSRHRITFSLHCQIIHEWVTCGFVCTSLCIFCFFFKKLNLCVRAAWSPGKDVGVVLFCKPGNGFSCWKMLIKCWYLMWNFFDCFSRQQCIQAET